MKNNTHSKTNKFNIVKEKTLIVTVDIGKTSNTGYYRTPSREDIKPFTFQNDGFGFNKFWTAVSKAMKKYNLESVIVGFESTGPYGEPLIHYLRKRGVRLCQVNPMHTKRLKELQGNSPGKTDYKDPKVIADIIELGHALTVIIPEGSAAEIRRLVNAREKAVQRQTTLQSQLHDLVFVLFPEFLEIMKGVRTKSAQYLLKHFPTPKSIVECGFGKLKDILRKTSHGMLSVERSKSLYEAAENSMGITEGQGGIVLEIKEILKIIELSNQYVAEIDKNIFYHLEQIPYSHSILSIKGIGKITTAYLIGETGDLLQFKTVGEVIKLAGFDLFEISSGKHKGNCHISKRGRILIRKILFFAALRVVRKGGILHKQYQAYLSRGMAKVKALVAISRKLLRIIFALVRNNTEYVVDYAKHKEPMVIKFAA